MIGPVKPWQNPTNDSFNDEFRDESPGLRYTSIEAS